MSYDATRQEFENVPVPFQLSETLNAVYDTLRRGEPLRIEFQRLQVESDEADRSDEQWMRRWTERARAAMAAASRRVM